MVVFTGETCDELERKKRLANVDIVLLSLFLFVLVASFVYMAASAPIPDWGMVIDSLPDDEERAVPGSASNPQDGGIGNYRNSYLDESSL